MAPQAAAAAVASSRPPKPIRTGSSNSGLVVIDHADESAEEKKVDTTENGDSKSTHSQGSRGTLRMYLEQRRASFTHQEHNFLAQLCDYGNEIEVSLALGKLCDPLLFFQDDDLEAEQQAPRPRQRAFSEREESSGSLPLRHVFVGRETSVGSLESSLHRSDSQDPLNNSGVLRTGVPEVFSSSDPTGIKSAARQNEFRSSISLGSLGSDQRRLMLEQRRESQRNLFNPLWNAHNSGLSFRGVASSVVAARRVTRSFVPPSAVPRTRTKLASGKETVFRASFGRTPSNSESSRRLMKAAGESRINIFRDRGSSVNNLSMDNTSPRRFLASRGLVMAARAAAASVSSSTAMSPRLGHVSESSVRYRRFSTTLEAEGGSPKPSLRRQLSESAGRSRSVTFSNDLPTIRALAETIQDDASLDEAFGEPPIPPRDQSPPARTTSNSSSPSIHLAHSVHSTPTLPSLRHAHSIRSNSVNSIPSIHYAHPVRSDSVFSSASEMPSERNSSDWNKSFRSLESVESDLVPAGTTVDTNIDSVIDGRDCSEAAGSQRKAEAVKDKAVPSIPSKVEIPNEHHDLSVLDGAPRLEVTGRGSQTQVLRDEDRMDQLEIEQKPFLSRPVLIRLASRNKYQGEGVELAEFGSEFVSQLHRRSPIGSQPSLEYIGSSYADDLSTVVTSHSFDESISYERISSIFRLRDIARSLSAEDVRAGVLVGGSRYIQRESSSVRDISRISMDDTKSWSLDEDDEIESDSFDPWKVLDDEYEGGGGGTVSFRILGTSGDDAKAHPHVLSPPLMESLQAFLPYQKSGESFWLKFSLVRDGSSLSTFLRLARGATHTVLAIETIDGEVFGSYTSSVSRRLTLSAPLHSKNHSRKLFLGLQHRFLAIALA
jgi:hypothetical protein